ncbi:ABC transporter permease [Spirillospora sp. NPDC048911]|uniref:ABC transporter permease n=1 Tax=Spirillospora sp. NPDC048911 TaxID=3364527 RepID=UPI00371496DA
MKQRLIRGGLGVLAFLVLAEAATRLGLIKSSVLPPMSAVVRSAVLLVGDTAFLRDVGATLYVWAVGMLLTIVVGVPLGVLLGTLPPVDRAVRGILEFLRPIPSVALVPLVIVIAQSDFRMRAIVIFYAALWPVLINTMYGMREVDSLAKETLRSYGFGRISVLWRVALPHSMPFVATGIRMAASVGLILAVSAELLAGGSHGLGVFILKKSSGIDTTDEVLAAAIWAGALGLVINQVLVQLERSMFRWHVVRTEAAL